MLSLWKSLRFVVWERVKWLIIETANHSVPRIKILDLVCIGNYLQTKSNVDQNTEYVFNPFPNKPMFLHVSITSLLGSHVAQW